MTYRLTSIATATHVGKVRDTNEDFVGVITNTYDHNDHPVLAVFDGLGGHAGGEIASAVAFMGAKRIFDDYCSGGDRDVLAEDLAHPPYMLTMMIQHAHRDITAVVSQKREYYRMGATAALAYLDGEHLYGATAGDSRIYQFIATTEKLQQISADDTVAEDLLARGVVESPEDELYRKNAHKLTQALGSPAAWINNNTYRREVADGDLVLVCSDGLTDMIDDERIAGIITETSTHTTSLDEVADALIEAALDAGGKDNVSVALARVSG